MNTETENPTIETTEAPATQAAQATFKMKEPVEFKKTVRILDANTVIRKRDDGSDGSFIAINVEDTNYEPDTVFLNGGFYEKAIAMFQKGAYVQVTFRKTIAGITEYLDVESQTVKKHTSTNDKVFQSALPVSKESFDRQARKNEYAENFARDKDMLTAEVEKGTSMSVLELLMRKHG